MQIELTLNRDAALDYDARDLGYLLHKHPEHVHQRSVGAGTATVFYTDLAEECATAVLYVNIDPVSLVRGKHAQADGLLEQYVNDRPFVANSFLSVALARSFGQSLSGRSRERQALADQALPFTARVVPVAVSGGNEIIETLFAPLGYETASKLLDSSGDRHIYDLRVSAVARLRDLLSHLYVLVPVLDNAKHWWVDEDEVDNLLRKGEGWLAAHPSKELITQRALRHRRHLVRAALERLEIVTDETDESAEASAEAEVEEILETPLRLHELRHQRVVEVLRERDASHVLDLGCGSGKLLARLLKEGGLKSFVGIDPSASSLARANRRLHLDSASEKLRERVKLRQGSLTYGDRSWREFDAATLIEVIEHIDLSRLPSLELSVFGDARPKLVIVTTPNREYNCLFENMDPTELRHRDHRFEFTRAEFRDWAQATAGSYAYDVALEPLGPLHQRYGAPSQMAIFTCSDTSSSAQVSS